MGLGTRWTAIRAAVASVAVGATAAAVAIAGPAAASGPAAEESCPDVLMIAARGSGQAQGAGAQLDGTFRALQAALPSVTVALQAVDYPALGAENALLSPDAFAASIAAGVTQMRRQARTAASGCPTTQIVLAGFSQGAMVTHQAVLDPRTARRASAVLLMADGFRTRVDRVRYLPSGPERARGVVVANVRSAAPAPIPARAGAKAVGLCLAGDVVCAWTAGADLAAGLRLHSTGYLDPQVQQQAADALADLLK